MNLNTDSISINPVASTPHLVLLFLLLACLSGWLAWKSTGRIKGGLRVLIVCCRLMLIFSLLALALNPGIWVEEQEDVDSYLSVLVDRSSSMATQDGEGGLSRWGTGLKFAADVVRMAGNFEAKAEVHIFDTGISPVKNNELSKAQPDGKNTDLAGAVKDLLSTTRNRRGKFAGGIIFTDGRQTIERGDAGRIALRARASESPFFILPIGGEMETVDLELRPSRRQFVAFAGQECVVTAKVLATGLGKIHPEITLLAPDGKEIDSEKIELSAGEEGEVKFRFPAPEPGVYLYNFQTPLWEGERIAVNNRAAFTLSVIDGKTKIFMAEGAPYWDSKFFAQLIRRQKNMQIVSVYRLADDRYFRVETGDDVPSEETQNVFPATAEELEQYDLVVIGKGAEYFLDEKRIALLSEYVRDRGGSVIFTRGKPYRGRFDALEFLEPVRWGERLTAPFRLQPTAVGEASGLFGEMLPGAKDPIWGRLPLLEEAHQVLEMKPFTEVLLAGQWQLDGRAQTLPVLMSRRFGRGMTAMLNVDGLWKWDFFPTEEGTEGQYEKFWSQLIQWAVTYSEFLPGQDLSLHLNHTIVRPGEMVQARIGYRRGQREMDKEVEPEPVLLIFRGTEEIRRIPASRPSEISARWEAGISLNEPGTYRIQAINLTEPDVPGPSLPITVLPPPDETEQLSADPVFLKKFAEATGGRLIKADQLSEIVTLLNHSIKESSRVKSVWKPLWDRWWWLPIILFIAALEWFTRRRSGLL